MKVFFCCRPAYGHVFPLLPLASAFRDAGHDVVFGTGEAFVEKVRAFGFETHRVGMDVATAEDQARQRVGTEDLPRLMFTMFGDILPRATLADLEPLLRKESPDLVVYEQSDVGAAGAARRAGIPVVSHIIGRTFPPEMNDQAFAALDWLWETPRPADALLGDACVDLWPDSLRDPGPAALPTVFRLRPVPHTVEGPLPDVVHGDRPLVYLTLGTVAYGATSVLRAAIDGLSRLPVNVLVALGPGDPAALGEVPDSVQVKGFVPQTEVLRHAALVVHHGGTGTTLGTLSAGLPQLVLPQGADQHLNAGVLSALGAARSLDGPAITADAVEAAARALLDDPAVRDVARRVGAEIDALPGPSGVVRDLTAFAAS